MLLGEFRACHSTAMGFDRRDARCLSIAFMVKTCLKILSENAMGGDEPFRSGNFYAGKGG